MLSSLGIEPLPSPLQENACQAVTSDVCHLLLSLLDPREYCTSRQALALQLLTKTVHVMHLVLPAEARGRDPYSLHGLSSSSLSLQEQVHVDSGVVMTGLLNSLSPR